MFCPSCGSQIRDDAAAFCTSCGSALPELPESLESRELPSDSQQKLRRKWPIVLAGVCTSLLLVVLVIGLLTGRLQKLFNAEQTNIYESVNLSSLTESQYAVDGDYVYFCNYDRTNSIYRVLVGGSDVEVVLSYEDIFEDVIDSLELEIDYDSITYAVVDVAALTVSDGQLFYLTWIHYYGASTQDYFQSKLWCANLYGANNRVVIESDDEYTLESDLFACEGRVYFRLNATNTTTIMSVDSTGEDLRTEYIPEEVISVAETDTILPDRVYLYGYDNDQEKSTLYLHFFNDDTSYACEVDGRLQQIALLENGCIIGEVQDDDIYSIVIIDPDDGTYYELYRSETGLDLSLLAVSDGAVYALSYDSSTYGEIIRIQLDDGEASALVDLEDLFEDIPLSLYTSLYTVVMDDHFVLCCDDTDGYGSIYVFNFDPDDGSLLF